MMGDSTRFSSYSLFHSFQVLSFFFISLYFCFSLICPHLHPFIVLPIPDSLAAVPPPSIHPVLDTAYPILLASLSSQQGSFLKSPRPTSSLRRKSHLIYFLLLLSGNVELNPGPPTPANISIASLNIRSASVISPDLDKPAVLHDFILDNSLDIVLLTETWLSPDTPVSVTNSLTPSNFSFFHQPRLTGRGGGLAVIHRSYLKISEIPPLPVSSFESLSFRLTLPTKTLNFLSVYRPPSSFDLLSLKNFLTCFPISVHKLPSCSFLVISTFTWTTPLLLTPDSSLNFSIPST